LNPKEFEFVESYVVLDWHVEDFDSKIVRYRFFGDNSIISEGMKASIEGKKFLAQIGK